MKQAESPLSKSPKTPIFLIGRDSRGRWVVQNEERSCGGLFVDRTQALRFAMFENANNPQAVIMVPGILELELNGKAAA